MNETKIIIESYRFSLKIIQLYDLLIQHNEYILSKQLLRSGTSIGANVFEASAAVSKKDFANKMAIASKEARETYYWLKLLKDSKRVPVSLEPYISNVKSIIYILTAIVKTTQSRIKDKN
jgi:four helix bundle protein